MTLEEMTIQELQRKVTEMEKRNRELEQLHQLDLSEITRLRRMIEQMEDEE